MFCEERGQLQYRIAEKKTLEDAYNVREHFLKSIMHVVHLFFFPPSAVTGAAAAAGRAEFIYSYVM